MKGLLIKDFKLMKGQKNFFLLVFVVALGMVVFTQNTLFVIGYMAFIAAMFTLSSISYDEFDNGNAFLFALPITRKGYVAEKYCFGLIIGGSAWLLATLIVMIAGSIRHTNGIEETLITAFIILSMMFILLAVMLPFQLKFGGEKGRIAIIGVFGGISVLGILIVKLANAVNIDLVSLINNLPMMSIRMFTVLTVVIGVFILFISAKISEVIVNKKEF